MSRDDAGRMVECAHCGIVSHDEAMSCEMGDCEIVDWRAAPRRERRDLESDRAGYRMFLGMIPMRKPER